MLRVWGMTMRHRITLKGHTQMRRPYISRYLKLVLNGRCTMKYISFLTHFIHSSFIVYCISSCTIDRTNPQLDVVFGITATHYFPTIWTKDCTGSCILLHSQPTKEGYSSLSIISFDFLRKRTFFK